MAATDASLRVLIILDITGSMSNEIEAVKQAVAEMVGLCSEQLDSAAGALAFAFITFTEGNHSGCHVSLKETSCLREAQQYIDRIKLAKPPDEPSVCASGGDEPENQKAALARTTDLDPSLPTIASLITDAPPHLASDRESMTARHELAYLTSQRGLSAAVAGDAIKCFRATALQHFAGNLVLNCVVYNNAYRGPDTSLMRLYGCFAQQTGGMLMQPESRNPAVLASGLTTVIKLLLSSMEGVAAPPQQNGPAAAGYGGGGDSDDEDDYDYDDDGSDVEQLEGFRLVDVSCLWEDVSSEADHLGSVAYGDSEALFAIAIQRMVAVCGSKWKKRALGMTAPAEQLQFVWHAARYIALRSMPNTSAASESAAAAIELGKLQALKDSILEQLPAEQHGQFSITLEDVQTAAAAASGKAAAGGGAAVASVSAISWESVGHALAVDADWEDWLAAVMRLLLGFPMRLQLPLDRYGQPDFMDAWSAVVERLGVDRISAAEFMQLVGDKPAAAGPTDRASHNALLVLVEPHDVLATLVFRLASGTQVLDYVTGVLMGAKGFLPNLHAGTAAACLTRLLSKPQPLSSFEWGQAQQIAHTLRSRHRSAAKAVSDEMEAGRANPADNISKLLLAALRLIADPAAVGAASNGALKQQQQQHVLRLVLQEWLASMIQRHYGKSTPETDAGYCQSLLQYIPLEALFGAGAAADIDSLLQLHPLEAFSLTPEQGVQLQAGWQAQILQRLAGGCPGVPAHPVLAPFLQRAGRLLALLLPADSAVSVAAASAVKYDGSCGVDDSMNVQAGPAAAVAWCWPDWQQGLVELLLLRQRTARYSTAAPATAGGAGGAAAAAAVASKTVIWVPAERVRVQGMVVEQLREALAEQLQGFRQARAAEAKRQLVAAAAQQLLRHSGSAEAVCEALQQLGHLQLGPQLAQGSFCSAGGPAAAPAAVAVKGPAAILLGQTIPLMRSDVPAVLESLGAHSAQPAEPPAAGGSKGPLQLAAVVPGAVTPAVLQALALGSWCSQGPQALRRSELVLQLITHFGAGSGGLLAAIRRTEECRRAAGFNSRGHSASLRYPGPEGWSLDYAEARVAALHTGVGRQVLPAKRFKTARYIQQMQRYAAVAAWAKQAAADGGGGKAAEVAGVVGGEMDANRLPIVVARLEVLLGVKVPAAVMEVQSEAGSMLHYRGHRAYRV